MIVHLKLLKPNPFRDFEVDPIDEQAVDRLKTSIQEDGFWGGVVCRRIGDELQIAAGHHRVEAALAAGIDEADVFVSDTLTDDDMIRVYARENSTQRGTSTGTARTGSVAAALRKVAYELFLQNSAEKRGQRQNNGIGRDAIYKKLESDPATTTYTVAEDLKSLKLSGHYARIVTEVRDRIHGDLQRAQAEAAAAAEKAASSSDEQDKEIAEDSAGAWQAEADEAAAALERAEAEAQRAGEQEILFDFKGVAQHLKNPNQIKAFRDMVLSPALSEIIPVDGQAAVAARIVERAAQDDLNSEGDGPSGRYIRETLYRLVLDLFQERHRREPTAEESERILGSEWRREARDRQNIFLSALRGAVIQAGKLLSHLREAPAEAFFAVNEDVRGLMRQMARVMAELEEKP